MLVRPDPPNAAQDVDAGEIDRLLSERLDACERREQGAFDEVSDSDHAPIVLLGGGQLGRRTLRALHRVGRPAAALTDEQLGVMGNSG